MLKKVTKNAKNLDEALKAAADELGVSVNEISHEIVRETGKNFFSKLLLGSEIEITAWITKEAENETNAKNKTSQKKQTKSETVTNKAPKVEVKADKEMSPKTEKSEKSEKIITEEAISNTNAKETTKPVSRNNKLDEEIEIPTEAVSDAKKFLGELLSKMGIDAQLYVKLGKNSIDIDVSGEKMGLLIGKRGDTLDAVQYLTSLYVNRSKEHYIKINIDTENYRAKREETLIRLAHGLERRVMREKKSITLEPMSPNERRIIHAALQRNNKIRTYSVGDEPNRKVVVALNK